MMLQHLDEALSYNAGGTQDSYWKFSLHRLPRILQHGSTPQGRRDAGATQAALNFFAFANHILQ